MNKITLYIKQAWMMIRQNKLFSSIYITGTGLSIALTMTLFVILYIKFAPLYPEYKRNYTLIINSIEKTEKDSTSNNYWQSTPNFHLVNMIRQLPSVDAVAGIFMGWETSPHKDATTEYATIPVVLKYTNADYWKVYDFEFIAGKPYSDSDVASKTKNVVISQSCAKHLFKTEDITNKIINVSGIEYKIIGIVKDVASVMDNKTAADMWAPYTTTNYTDIEDLLGDCELAITAKSPDKIEIVKSEVAEMMHKYNQQDKLYNYQLFGPDIFWASQFRQGKMLNEKEEFLKYGYILFALLIIPALNLSGMISSRMNKRLPELGIRKTYGATNSQLLSQILWENFLLTIIGGLVGIIISYTILLCGSAWITNILTTGLTEQVQLLSDNLSLEMLFNWWVFVAVLTISFILNIVSALIPASISLRQTIINSLNPKQ